MNFLYDDIVHALQNTIDSYVQIPPQTDSVIVLEPEQTMDQRVMGHGSNGSTNVNGSRGSRVSTVKHLTHD